MSVPITARILMILLALLPLPSVFAQNITDRGGFAIYRDGKPLGTELFDINLTGGTGTVKARISYKVDSDHGTLEVNRDSTLVLGRNAIPTDYRLTSTAQGQSNTLQVEFKPKVAICTFDLGKEKKTQGAILGNNTLILDDNVFCHWIVLMSRYDRSRKGRQEFAVFVPQLGESGATTITVESAGSDTVKLGMRSEKGLHYKVSTTEGAMDLWTDSSGRLLKIAIPSSNSEILRVQ